MKKDSLEYKLSSLDINDTSSIIIHKSTVTSMVSHTEHSLRLQEVIRTFISAFRSSFHGKVSGYTYPIKPHLLSRQIYKSIQVVLMDILLNQNAWALTHSEGLTL